MQLVTFENETLLKQGPASWCRGMGAPQWGITEQKLKGRGDPWAAPGEDWKQMASSQSRMAESRTQRCSQNPSTFKGLICPVCHSSEKGAVACASAPM